MRKWLNILLQKPLQITIFLTENSKKQFSNGFSRYLSIKHIILTIFTKILKAFTFCLAISGLMSVLFAKTLNAGIAFHSNPLNCSQFRVALFSFIKNIKMLDFIILLPGNTNPEQLCYLHTLLLWHFSFNRAIVSRANFSQNEHL